MKRFCCCLTLLSISLISLIAPDTFASATLRTPIDELYEQSDAVFRGQVVGVTTYRAADGLIYTRTSLRVNETLKGICPEIIAVEHRGGQVENEHEFFGLSPKLIPSREYLLFVRRNAAGKLECTQGHASAFGFDPSESASTANATLKEARSLAAIHPNAGSDVMDQVGAAIIQPQATTGMLGNENSRFLQPDRGEPIPVLIDADILPIGITLQQATNAVWQALNAWAAVSSLKFKIEGIVSFGLATDTIDNGDQKLRIQLHDSYNRISSPDVLGIGGRFSRTSASPSGWDLGGNVAGNEFRRTENGYVVLESGAAAMQDLQTFTEVLCHEIGHALNMAHSSEDPEEPNATLNQAMMYFRAHRDGRGATLGAYDPPIIRQAYPFNTVPYTFNRVLDVTSAPVVPLDVPGINEVEVRGYDLQTANLTLHTNDQSVINGNFSLNGNKVKFTPGGYYFDSDRYDPTEISHRGIIYVRFSDGTNASPYATVRVLSLRGEATIDPDGIPDYWMINYFGNATPSEENLSRATDDADGDGLNTLQEYRSGTNPLDANSRLKITQFTGDTLTFQAQAYELYELHGTTNFVDWHLVKPFLPTTDSIAIRTSLPQTNILATISNLPTTGAYRFYRIEKVP